MSQQTGNKVPHVVIVGGGMVGISLALMLSKKTPEFTITLIEKSPFPEKKLTKNPSELPIQKASSFDARSTALSAGSMQLLADIGCWNLLSEFVAPINNIHISDKNHYAGNLLKASDYAVDALGYVVENAALGQCLLYALEQTNINCLAPATVVGCDMTKNGVCLSVSDSATGNGPIIDADLVVIADGGDSPLCQSLGINRTLKSYQQSAIITNVALATPHQGIAYERFTDQGPLALLPLTSYEGDHRASVVWTKKTTDVDALLELNDQKFLAALQKCFGYRAGRFIKTGQRHVYPLELIQSDEQVRSHVVVMGNAAHFLHPVAGQGFNLSLRDCAVLTNVVSKNITAPGVYTTLKQYEQNREMDQQITIGLTDSMVKLFSSSACANSLFRQSGLLLLNAIPTAKRNLAQQMMGIA